MAQGLRIKAVERMVVDVPFTPRCAQWNAREVHQWRLSEVIRLTTDDPDLVGWGETILYYTWGRVPDAAIERVVGANPADLLGDDTLGAGLQMALYDLVGKALGVPTYRLFNLPRVREWCPISWWNIDMPPEANAEEAKAAVAAGYTSYKIKARPWWDVIEQVEAISAVTPPGFHLDLDWNDMLLDVGNAAPLLRALEKYERVAIFEGPIPQRDVEGYCELRRKTDRPIAIHFGAPPFATAARAEMCDGFVMSWGGVSGLLGMAAQSHAFEKPFWIQMVGTGLTTAMAAHLGAVLPGARWPAVSCMNNYADDLLAAPLTITGGYLRVPDGPGLGVTVDEGALDRYRIDPPYRVPETAHILSVVWPGGRVMHYASMCYRHPVKGDRPFAHERYGVIDPGAAKMQCWEDFLAGNQPVNERGVRMEVWEADGSPEWADLYRRALQGPVRDQR